MDVLRISLIFSHFLKVQFGKYIILNFLFGNNFKHTKSCKSKNNTKNIHINFTQIQLLLAFYPICLMCFFDSLSLLCTSSWNEGLIFLLRVTIFTITEAMKGSRGVFGENKYDLARQLSQVSLRNSRKWEAFFLLRGKGNYLCWTRGLRRI